VLQGPPPCTIIPGSTTFNDGTSVPALAFANVAGFDTYSQTIPTMADRPYTVDFLYTVSRPGEGFLTVSTTPLPSSFTLFAIGLVGLGLVALARRGPARDPLTLTAT
jgi:hypothetical protein